MKIRITRRGGDFDIEIGREPMEESRFLALCYLFGVAICGAVVLGVVYLAGFWAIPWACGAFGGFIVYMYIKRFPATGS